MFTDILPGNTKAVLETLGRMETISDFYLSGGTALALQIGHRESEDLDFFSEVDFEPTKIQKEFEKLGKLDGLEVESGTLNFFWNGVKIQFLHYPYKLLERKVVFNGIQISSKIDIACTKLLTVSSRGSKKDFIDIYFLLQEYDPNLLFEKLKEKYPESDYNQFHILKSLVYFADADDQPSPRMHKKVDWEEIKEEITKKIVAFRI